MRFKLLAAILCCTSMFCSAQDHPDKLLLLKCVEFDGTPSVQVESKDLIFQWTFGDGTPDDYGEIVEHCYDSLGTFKVSLSVIEPVTKITFMEEHNITVDIQPDLILDIAANPVSQNKMRFTPTLEGDLEYENLVHFWDFGDGEYGVEVNPTHQFEDKGEYVVRLLTKLIVGDEEYQLSKTITVRI